MKNNRDDYKSLEKKHNTLKDEFEKFKTASNAPKEPDRSEFLLNELNSANVDLANQNEKKEKENEALRKQLDDVQLQLNRSSGNQNNAELSAKMVELAELQNNVSSKSSKFTHIILTNTSQLLERLLI